MPKISQTYSSGGWLKASIFAEAGIDQAVFGVSGASLENCKSFKGDVRPAVVLTLEGRKGAKKWELNRTNGELIAAFLGDDTDHWIGKEVGIKLVRGVRFPFGVADVLEAYNPAHEKAEEQTLSPPPPPPPDSRRGGPHERGGGYARVPAEL